ncbi:MAG: hypothetical protein ACLFOY_12595 [Desulfatibacillaceae bacterium]
MNATANLTTKGNRKPKALHVLWILAATALLLPAAVPANAVDVMNNEQLANIIGGSTGRELAGYAGTRAAMDDAASGGETLSFPEFLAKRDNGFGLADKVALARETGDGAAALKPALNFMHEALASALGVFDEVVPLNVFRGFNLNDLNVRVTGVEFPEMLVADAGLAGELATIRFEADGVLPTFRMDTPGGSLEIGDITVKSMKATVVVRR